MHNQKHIVAKTKMMKRRDFVHKSLVLLAFASGGTAIACAKKSKASYTIKQFEDEGLAHFSYAILVDNKIVLVDPARDPQPYYDYADEQEAEIIGVIETHPHADFVSSHLQIHQEKQAKIYVSRLVHAAYPHQTFDEGDHIALSDTVTLVALHTPGHSPDSISVVLREEDKDVAVFSGDALLFGSVGRPDLREYSGEAAARRQELAKQMYHTVHQKYAALNDNVLVYPAHGAGSLCGNAIRDVKESTIGYERAHNFGFQIKDEQEFVKILLQDQPYIPKYFPYNVELNKKGAPTFEQAIKAVSVLPVTGTDVSQTLVVDTRGSRDFRASHLPQSVNIPDNKKFETWLGTFVDPEDNFYLVVGDEIDKEKQLSKAAKIGYEALVKAILIYKDHQGQQFSNFDKVDFDKNKGDYIILDVRTVKEASEDPVFENVVNIPLSELEEKIATLPTDKPIYVHCASGYRSSIGSSLIKKVYPNADVYDIGSEIIEYKKSNRNKR